jgi:esterase/lipase
MTRKVARVTGTVLVALLLAYAAGPAVTIDTRIRPIALPQDLDRYLAQSESRYRDIVPGAEKAIIWANAARTRTRYAVVYVHGFSATRRETAPLSDTVAARLGANLFYTRLAGHGRGEAAMADATVNDWLNDVEEAYEIGRRLGDDVIVIGSSTGATLATWLAEQPHAQHLAALVLLSPNYAVRDGRADVLILPWGALLARVLVGPAVRVTTSSAQEAKYWSHQYPSRALVPMIALVRFVRRSPVERIRVPVQFIYSPDDRVVDVRETERVFARLGSRVKERALIEHSQNPSSHVLAGDIVAPRDTPRVAQLILAFLGALK